MSSSKDIHLEKVKANQKIKYANNPYFNLEQRYQARINNYFENQKYKAEDLLGSTIPFFKRWIEFRMKPGMNFDNIDLDHIIPLETIKDKNDENQIYRIFNWTNITPSLSIDNKRKGIRRDPNLERDQDKYIRAFLTSNFGL